MQQSHELLGTSRHIDVVLEVEQLMHACEVLHMSFEA